MPAGQPFTGLCQELARLARPSRADLHMHTTHSDGMFDPAEVVRRAGLAMLHTIAVTDHDTYSALPELVAAARNTSLQIVPGVEITAEFRGRELHLLGYFFRPDDEPLNAALSRLRHDRRERLTEIVRRLRAGGMSVPDEIVAGWLAKADAGVGRRQIAVYLAQSGQVRTVNDAFHRHLHESNVPTKLRLPVAEAIRLVRNAGGVASWAHPRAEATADEVGELREMGIGALEAEYPWPEKSHRRAIRQLADDAGLCVSGGSDCHGPTPVRRAVGSCGVTGDELRALRSRAIQYGGAMSSSGEGDRVCSAGV